LQLGRHCLGFPAPEADIVMILHAIIASHQRSLGSDLDRTTYRQTTVWTAR
jgi:hypothetical protein